ncbi:MAG: LD-carboxypeptidase [Cryomorphaceae bacterium]|jgi:muramoyltetrapeptide carboxypeptidase|nr:LD-carboxypeptidase [Cryomorphaceae bacterium]
MSIAPEPINEGDLIYITAPAKAIEAEYLEFAQEFLQKKGFRVLLSEHCGGRSHYFSGTDEERMKDLQFGLDHEEVKAILCARGGYGCVRIVDSLEWAGMLRQPKWLIGFSDITVFHQRLQRFGIQSIHGTMVLNLPKNSNEALETFINAITGTEYSIEFSAHKENKNGVSSGELVGGNLSILYSLLGTDDQIDYSGKILFIEDLAEHIYHIDRMLYAFKKCGVFENISGLLVGGMTDLEDTDVAFGKSVEEIIREQLTYRNIPVAFGFPAGHIEDNRALILGRKSTLSVNNDACTIKWL